MGKLARNHGALLAILFLGTFLRFYQLGTESLWRDEGWTTWFASLGSPSEIVEQSKTDNNFPTYYLILRYWIGLFGDSEFSVRFSSALAGVLAVFAIYKVGQLLFGRSTGLIASLLLTLAPFHIAYSQEARVYSFMTLLAVLSFYFFLEILAKPNPAPRTGYVLSTTALLYCHVYGLFIVLAQNIYYLTTAFLGKASGSRDGTRPGLGGWVLLQALLLVLYVPAFILLAGWISSPTGRGWITPPSLSSAYFDFIAYSGSRWLLILLLIFSLLAVVGLLKSGAGSKLYLLLLWLLTPVALPIAISVFSTPIFFRRYAIVATPALYLLAAKGVEVASDAFSRAAFLTKIPQALKANAIRLIVATALVVLSSGVLWNYFERVNKAQWREAAQYMDARLLTNDLVLVYPEKALPVLVHYSDRTDVRKEPLPPDGDASTAQSIKEHERFWVVYDQTTPAAYDKRFPRTLLIESHNPIFSEQRYAGITLTLYEKKYTQDY